MSFHTSRTCIAPRSLPPSCIGRDSSPEETERSRITRLGGQLLLVAVVFSVGLGRFLSLMPSMQMMSLGHVRVMGRLFVRTGVMMLGSFFVMSSGMLVMFGCLPVMFRSLFRHAVLLRPQGELPSATPT
jgi:hypothetical protein